MRKADNLPPSCAIVTESGNLNFLEPSGPLQACNGTDLPFYVNACIHVNFFLLNTTLKTAKEAETCRWFTICLYIIVSNYIAVVGVCTVM